MHRLVYLFFVLIMAGCSFSGAHSADLDRAESLLPDRPREAFDRLNAVDVSGLGDSATVARWALLYCEAMAGSGLHAPSDSIAGIAIDYYGSHGNEPMYRRAMELRQVLADTSEGADAALVTALYLQKEKEFKLYRERAARTWWLMTGVIILLIGSGVIVWQRQRLRIKSAENDALVAEAAAMGCRLADERAGMADMRKKLMHVFEDRFALIDDLCRTYYESQGTRVERRMLADKVKAEIDAIRTDGEVMASMERTVNDCRSNLLVVLREEYPDISQADYQLAVYLACGLSSSSISLLVGESIDTVYKRKSRLKSRIRERSLPHGADFLAIF